MVMAGGLGSRLHPLTRDRAKPAVPFGGKYRIIDFVLSNLVNSRIYAIYVLVQWRSQSLIEHLKDGWQFGGILNDQFVTPGPGPDADGRELVPGHRRRHLPEPQPARRQQPRSGRGLRRRPYLPDGRAADDRVPSRAQGGRDRRHAPGVASRKPTSSASSRSTRGFACRASRRSRPRPIRCRGRRDNAWPRWATTCSIPRCCAAR